MSYSVGDIVRINTYAPAQNLQGKTRMPDRKAVVLNIYEEDGTVYVGMLDLSGCIEETRTYAVSESDMRVIE